MRKLLVLVTLVSVLAACGNDEDKNPPQAPTQIVLVVTATPEPATQTAQAATSTTTADTAAPTLTQLVVTTAASTTTPTTQPQASATFTVAPATPTALPANFPTPVLAPLPVAEQVFEHGRMFWLRPNRQIWVMVASPDNPNGGDWYCFVDNFEEGEQETDPSLVPPADRYQPRRGFGKLWRNNPDLKAALGWGLTPEFELTSNYMYLAGGTVQNGTYVPAAGEHRLTTLYNETISLFEGQQRGECQPSGTWQMAPVP
ncbi:MAG TPA: hypothetical protein VHP83_16420 [Aggregatilineaceae bacterium]|nr:hypothetical protein [Aggregatilineaceae bacterium]